MTEPSSTGVVPASSSGAPDDDEEVAVPEHATKSPKVAVRAIVAYLCVSCIYVSWQKMGGLKEVLLAVPAAGAQTSDVAGVRLGRAFLALAAATPVERRSVVAAAIERLTFAPRIAGVSRIAGAHAAGVLYASVARPCRLPAAVTRARSGTYARCWKAGAADAFFRPRNGTIAVRAITHDRATVEGLLAADPTAVALTGGRTRVLGGCGAIATRALQIRFVVLPRFAFARDGGTRLRALEVLGARVVVVNAARVRPSTSLFESRLLASAVLHAAREADEVSALAFDNF